jgi:hypothetical protein
MHVLSSMSVNNKKDASWFIVIYWAAAAAAVWFNANSPLWTRLNGSAMQWLLLYFGLFPLQNFQSKSVARFDCRFGFGSHVERLHSLLIHCSAFGDLFFQDGKASFFLSFTKALNIGVRII